MLDRRARHGVEQVLGPLGRGLRKLGVPADALTVAIAQLNPTVGDIDGNAERARQARAQAARDGADLVAFPELFICGYPPEDLVLKPALTSTWCSI